ncbi:serine/threonine protein kinase [Calothrix sp. NIES-2100]|uniref:serine/threonine-protein kinase n=1 Tax=Calothrix sp. NIES-2100 TaxID=1954172 RepID=UPI000B5FE8D7|nr:serine/threonine protein kinase [Calothrix sp. NIES-2100]
MNQKLGGRYQILKQIGKGGFGVTFLAEDTQRPGNPKCVVKQFQPMSTNPRTLTEAQRLFQTEAETLEKLGKHDQIPQLLAHFEENQEFYLVEEYIAGQDLSHELLPGTKLSEADTIQLLKDILEVLIFIHQQKVIHRDIKPSNIIRRTDGKIILIDFGAVKQISTQIVLSSGQTQISVAVGTPGYMPSEQTSGNPVIGSDIYAVGILGIQALTGIQAQQLPKDVNHEIVWRDQAQVHKELASILDRMVRYDFRQRYESAEKVLQALQQLSLNSTLPPTILHKYIPDAIPWKWIIPSFTVVAASIAIFIIFKPSISQPPTPPRELLSYEDSDLNIKIKYPDNWDRQDLKNPITGEWVKFLSPKQSPKDNFQEQLTIKVEDFSKTLEDSQTEFVKEIKNSSNSKITSSNTTTLAHKKAYQLIYTVTNEENNLKNLRIWTLNGDKAYIIVYTAAIDDYDTFLQTAQTMIKSFEIN